MTDISRTPRPGRGTLSRKKRVMFSAAIICGSVLLSLLALEVVMRAVEPKSPPGTTYGRPVVTNSDGLRDREFAIPKPTGRYRILVLGDSFTWGVGLNVEETIPKQLEAALQGTTTGNIEVVNASWPGMNTVNELEMLKKRGLKYEPDMILLVYLLNDVDFKPELAPKSYNEEAATPVVQIDAGRDVTKWSKWKGVRGAILRVEQMSALARFLVPRGGHLLRNMGLLDSVEFSWVAKIFQGFDQANPGWQESQRALREITALSRERQIPVVVAIYPLLVGLDNYQGREANRTVAQYAKSIGVSEAVDLLPVFEGKNGRSFWVNYADHHPNAEAHRMVTAELLPVIRRQLPPALVVGEAARQGRAPMIGVARP